MGFLKKNDIGEKVAEIVVKYLLGGRFILLNEFLAFKTRKIEGI